MSQKKSFFAATHGYRMGANYRNADGRNGWYYWAETPYATGLKGWIYVGDNELVAEAEFRTQFRSLSGAADFEVHTAEGRS